MRKPGVAGKGVPEIFPERVDPLVGMQRPQRVGPALRDQAAIGVAHLRPEQGVIDPALRRIDVEIGRHDVEVAGQNGRRAAVQKAFGVARQPFEPAQLVIEFRARRRIAVRQIEASDDQAADRRFDVAAVRVVGIARQAAAGLHRLGAAGEDRHAVPALLPVPDRAIAGGAERGGRKFLIGRLQLLQADDVRRGLLQPAQQVGEPPVDAVDVVGRDPHRNCPRTDVQAVRRQAG